MALCVSKSWPSMHHTSTMKLKWLNGIHPLFIFIIYTTVICPNVLCEKSLFWFSVFQSGETSEWKKNDYVIMIIYCKYNEAFNII